MASVARTAFGLYDAISTQFAAVVRSPVVGGFAHTHTWATGGDQRQGLDPSASKDFKQVHGQPVPCTTRQGG
ncbi:hypothetical protein CLI92_08695 [Vandammella animalimorsus]|uniref:Uncharacterized protein n=1 Tax=Vandammella animalimorsus TaxID=2029117 RepID=A0A2A2T4N5_9BURK|nr:hypothetical protein CLI92_08695 [Vandammella animalimorsus]PAX18825.1 hypothetical protein CLI93_10775 [Vandammella animalimorsus]